MAYTHKIEFRSQIEAKWFLFLSKCWDIHRIQYEPTADIVKGRWIPDFSFFTGSRKVLAEVKFDGLWKQRQYKAAMELLNWKQKKISNVVLLSSEGRVTVYSPGEIPGDHSSFLNPYWGELERDFVRNRTTGLASLNLGATSVDWKLFT